MEDPQKINTLVPIYSKKVVLGFCIFVNPIFGGVMLRQNLIDINERKAGLQALLFSISLFMITAMISTTFLAGFAIIFASNLIGGAVIVEYYYRKYFPDEQKHEKKSIFKPLRIALLLAFVLALLLIVFGVQLPK